MSTIDTRATIGEIVRHRPSRTRVLEDLGIDYCCGGNKPLDQACREKGLDPDTVVQVLQAAERATAQPAGSDDLSVMTMTQLADHIEQTHHVYLQQELPRLIAITKKVAAVHGQKAGELLELAEVVEGLAGELLNHMAKEEQVLFPSLRELEATGRISHACFGTVRNPIRVMEHEHDSAGQMLGRIRSLTHDYAFPSWGCATYRTMLEGLAQLEADTHQHIHKENNILFPLAIEAETRTAQAVQ